MRAALRDKVSWREELRGNLRGIGLVVRSAPVLVASELVITLFQGLLAPLVVVGTGRFVTAVERMVTADAALEAEARSALFLIGGALVFSSLTGPVSGALHYGVQERFRAYLARRIMTSVTTLPGLAYHEDPEFRDKLHVSEWIGWAPANSVRMLRQMAQNVVTLAGMAVVAAQFAWWAPVVTLAVTLPEAVSAWFNVGKTGWLRRIHSEESRRADYFKRLALELEPAKEVRVFRLADWVLGREMGHWLESYRESWAARRSNLLRRFGLHAVVVAGLSFVYLSLVRAAISGRVDAGAFAATVMALTTVVGMALALSASAAHLRQVNFYLPTALRLLDLPENDTTLDTSGRRSARGLEPTGIRFEDVTFAYPGTERQILNHLNLDIPPGSSVALVGENGAGKTTLIKLLCRFYDPTSGRITLDGVDIREFDVADLRRRMAVIFQDFVRYHLPAQTNIGFGAVERQNDDALIREAAGRVGVLERINELPDGWDTVLSRDFGGSDLSGGEWQRVALARAITAQLGGDADLLILDEPTAALDVRVEHDLYERFAELVAGRTTILVSHRFSTVRMADRIVLLDGGRVVEDGSHAALMAAGGHYARLYELQASHYRLTGSLE